MPATVSSSESPKVQVIQSARPVKNVNQENSIMEGVKKQSVMASPKVQAKSSLDFLKVNRTISIE